MSNKAFRGFRIINSTIEITIIAVNMFISPSPYLLSSLKPVRGIQLPAYSACVHFKWSGLFRTLWYPLWPDPDNRLNPNFPAILGPLKDLFDQPAYCNPLRYSHHSPFLLLPSSIHHSLRLPETCRSCSLPLLWYYCSIVIWKEKHRRCRIKAA